MPGDIDPKNMWPHWANIAANILFPTLAVNPIKETPILDKYEKDFDKHSWDKYQGLD